jgi:hypothetical protein
VRSTKQLIVHDVLKMCSPVENAGKAFEGMSFLKGMEVNIQDNTAGTCDAI